MNITVENGWLSWVSETNAELHYRLDAVVAMYISGNRLYLTVFGDKDGGPSIDLSHITDQDARTLIEKIKSAVNAAEIPQ
jgi:hypothetical protein